jgi:hypothetical protein
VGGTTSASTRAPTPVAPGTVIGRFVVVGAAGAGAMGAVLIAYDPTLDRKVALKLLHGGGAASDAARARLEREAQALAKLTAPNLVRVFDVLTWQEQLVVAMEYVDGSNLREWLAAQPRSWRDVVRVFADAGRGLEAAHAAGLVHRDFKPDNVLLSRAGEVKVSDFGMVAFDDEPSTGGADRSELLTVPGALLGTPAYMAPELFRGAPATPASDQFAFAVSLEEALTGTRPFEAAPLAELVATRGARARRPRPNVSAPRWLLALVERAMADAPEARFPTLTALLQQLTRDRRREWARRGWAALALLGIGLALAVKGRPPDPCGDPKLSLRAAWAGTSREAVRAALADNAGQHQALQVLDDYTHAWDAHLLTRCRFSHAGPPPPEVMPFLTCLHGVAADFHATTDALAARTPPVLERLALLDRALAPVTACDSLAGLERRGPEAPLASAPALAFRLAELETLPAARVAPAAVALIGDATGPENQLLRVRARLLLAEHLVGAGQGPAAVAAARAATLDALAPPRSPTLIAQAWATLGLTLATGSTNLDEARHALALSAVPLEDATLTHGRLAVEAELALHDDAPTAVDLARRARAAAQTALEVALDDERLARALLTRGLVDELLAASRPSTAGVPADLEARLVLAELRALRALGRTPAEVGPRTDRLRALAPEVGPATAAALERELSESRAP